MNIIFFTGLSGSGKTTIAEIIGKHLNVSVISLRQDVLHPLAAKHGLKRGRYWVLATIKEPKLLMKERAELVRLIKLNGSHRQYVIIDDLIDPGAPIYLRKQLKKDKVIVIRIKTNRHMRRRWILKRTGFSPRDSLTEQKFLDLIKHKAGIKKAIKAADFEVKNFDELEQVVAEVKTRLAFYLNGMRDYPNNKTEGSEENVDIMNTKWRIIGKVTRSEAHKKGFLHPTVKIVILNSLGALYIQQRSIKKSILPFYWDISVSEHLKSGESYREAAVRGLIEELGVIAKVKLLRGKHIQRSGKLIKEYEVTVLYGAWYDGNIKVDSEEVADGKFVSLDKLRKLVKGKKLKFTPWGLNEIHCLLNHSSVLNKGKTK